MYRHRIMRMLSLKAMHVQVTQPTMPQSSVILSSKCDWFLSKTVYVVRGQPRTSMRPREEVQSVPRRYQHPHSCGDKQHAGVSVGGKRELTPRVFLHPAHTEELADTLRRPRGQIRSIESMNASKDRPTGNQANRNPHSFTALYCDSDATDSAATR
jgi:hypothetical protein